MQYDYSKLSGRIVEKFGSRKAFAGAMGMEPTTLSMKLNNKQCWSQPQISKAVELLEIPAEKIQIYFFTLTVQSA